MSGDRGRTVPRGLQSTGKNLLLREWRLAGRLDSLRPFPDVGSVLQRSNEGRGWAEPARRTRLSGFHSEDDGSGLCRLLRPDHRSSGPILWPTGRDAYRTLPPCPVRVTLIVAEAWISRHFERTVPPQVIDAMTPKVVELDGVMVELDRIAERWYGQQ